jgi:hypothetical protein
MKRKRLFHILRLLHFRDNRNESDETDKYYDRLWETRTIFGKFIIKKQTVWDKDLHALLF